MGNHTNKTERLKEFIGIVLKEDTNDLRGLDFRETTVNLGLSILMVMVTVLHLVLSCWQFVVSLLLVGYDALSKGLERVMPAPKMGKETK